MAGRNRWGRPQRLLFIGVALLVTVALSSSAYTILLGNDQGTVFTSFLFQDGSEEWQPIDIDRSIDNIEALQQMENRGLANMILELDRNPGSTPTDEELERLWTLYRESFEAAAREGWFVYSNAIRAGFSYDENDPTHYPNERNLSDDRDLAPDRPEFLMFYPDPDDESEKILVGVMFQKSTFDAHGEQIGGSVSRWHKHIYGTARLLRSSAGPSEGSRSRAVQRREQLSQPRDAARLVRRSPALELRQRNDHRARPHRGARDADQGRLHGEASAPRRVAPVVASPPGPSGP
jgi:hypothetical protein